MDINGFVSGWISEPARVQDSILSRAAGGQLVMGASYCAQGDRDLEGTWRREVLDGVKGIFLRDFEKRVNGGKYRRPFLQEDGTCVGRGQGKGCQLSTDVAVCKLELIQRVEIAWAPIYTMARHEIGRDRCGAGAGAILADAARAVSELGVATTAIHGGDEERQVERMAVKYAAPGVGTPNQWKVAASGHTCVTFWPETIELLCDCLAAGYAVPYAHSYVTAMPNKSGISGLGSFGPHCRCFTGVFLDENGEVQLISSESWGRFPAGQPSAADRTMPVEEIPCITLRYAGGERKMAPGDVGVNAKQFWAQIRQGGEAWAVGPAKYQSKGIA